MKPFISNIRNTITQMFNKTNITILTTISVIVCMGIVPNASAFKDLKDFIPYSELNSTMQNENYIGFHMVDLHLFVWYHNNHVSGFTVDTVNNEQQQKELDAQ